jgi:hypothetical protein
MLTLQPGSTLIGEAMRSVAASHGSPKLRRSCSGEKIMDRLGVGGIGKEGKSTLFQ